MKLCQLLWMWPHSLILFIFQIILSKEREETCLVRIFLQSLTPTPSIQTAPTHTLWSKRDLKGIISQTNNSERQWELLGVTLWALLTAPRVLQDPAGRGDILKLPKTQRKQWGHIAPCFIPFQDCRVGPEQMLQSFKVRSAHPLAVSLREFHL